MRRTLLAAGAIVASAALLAGCGAGTGTEDESSGPVTLQMWSWDPSMPEIAKVWNESHPDI
ncbi:hypothetical protein RN51_00296 [Microbacterium oxydans]|uniref:Sugar ABC transporter substrate-binding protein n=1 Tax=Microbacterium oxydans TaxID=82380 RepID=A0A0F0L3G5_9MICO|nr:hypothetical protein [Microbacterium oxydans]KJL26076.1 hypothetical protein RN51_00296 [Microbacterium oxydans]